MNTAVWVLVIGALCVIAFGVGERRGMRTNSQFGMKEMAKEDR